MRFLTALTLTALALAAAPARAADAPSRTIRSLQVLAAIYRGAPDDAKRMDDAAVQGTKNGILLGRLFYFRNSRAELDLDITFQVFDAPMPDNQGPTYEHIEKDLRARGIRDNQYDGVYATGIGATGNWGGYRILGRTGAAFGTASAGTLLGWYPANDPAMHYNTAWTFVHEFQHALDITIASISGRPDMLHAHPYADNAEPHFKWGHRGGQHWDWISHTLRSFRDYTDVRGATDSTITFTDADGDGLPDDEPRLPMDEKRFGSDPTKKDTDGDGLDDLGEFTADIYRGSDPRRADTDGDGIPDGRDRNPTVAIAETIRYSDAAPVVDGRMDTSYGSLSSGLYFTVDPALEQARVHASWNEDGLHLFVKSSSPTGLEMQIDTSAENGYWEGGDTFGIKAMPDGKVTFFEGPRGEVPGAKAAMGPDGLEVFIPALIGAGLSNEVNWGGAKRPEDTADGLVLGAGRDIALNLILANPERRALITPQWTLFNVALAKRPTDPPRPSLRFNAPVTRDPQPSLTVSGVGPNDRVAILDARGRTLAERIGGGPMILMGGLKTGSDARSGANTLVARSGGRTSAPFTLIVDATAAPPVAKAGTDGRSLDIQGEPGATVTIYAGTDVSPVWGIGTVVLDQKGQGRLTRPEGPHAFLGAYHPNIRFDGPTMYRLDPKVEFEYQDKAPAPGLPTDNVSIRWSGYLDVPRDGEYTFYLSTDDGSRLYLGGAPVIDHWGHHEATEKSATLRLSKGEHPIRVDYYEEDGWASAHLEWSGPGIARTHALPVSPLPSSAGRPVYYARQTDVAGNVSAFARAR